MVMSGSRFVCGEYNYILHLWCKYHPVMTIQKNFKNRIGSGFETVFLKSNFDLKFGTHLKSFFVKYFVLFDSLISFDDEGLKFRTNATLFPVQIRNLFITNHNQNPQSTQLICCSRFSNTNVKTSFLKHFKSS